MSFKAIMVLKSLICQVLCLSSWCALCVCVCVCEWVKTCSAFLNGEFCLKWAPPYKVIFFHPRCPSTFPQNDLLPPSPCAWKGYVLVCLQGNCEEFLLLTTKARRDRGSPAYVNMSYVLHLLIIINNVSKGFLTPFRVVCWDAKPSLWNSPHSCINTSWSQFSCQRLRGLCSLGHCLLS